MKKQNISIRKTNKFVIRNKFTNVTSIHGEDDTEDVNHLKAQYTT